LAERDSDHGYGREGQSGCRGRVRSDLAACIPGGVRADVASLPGKVRSSVNKRRPRLGHRISSVLSDMLRHFSQTMHDILVDIGRFIAGAPENCIAHGLAPVLRTGSDHVLALARLTIINRH
jgi:hypothetical protein